MKEKNVQPLRTAKEIEDMKWALRRYGSERDYFLFVFGINTGLRVSDIVPLTVGDVRDKSHVVIREKKTNKTKRFMLPVKLREEIEDYTAHMSDGEYLFPSRKLMDRLLLPKLTGCLSRREMCLVGMISVRIRCEKPLDMRIIGERKT